MYTIMHVCLFVCMYVYIYIYIYTYIHTHTYGRDARRQARDLLQAVAGVPSEVCPWCLRRLGLFSTCINMLLTNNSPQAKHAEGKWVLRAPCILENLFFSAQPGSKTSFADP